MIAPLWRTSFSYTGNHDLIVEMVVMVLIIMIMDQNQAILSIIMICSDNVPVVERVACRVRAQVAGAAVSGLALLYHFSLGVFSNY